MIRTLIRWSVQNPLIVLLLAFALAAGGGFAFTAVNIEAYPDPAPAIIEVIGQYPGKSAEQVEEQVTIPLEQALAGMPGLTYTRSKSLFGLAHLRNQFDYGIDYECAKQEVLNRLADANLPPGVKPDISPTSPTGEIYRYSLRTPTEADGRAIYSLNDVKALEDWTLERVFGRIPRIAGVVSSGGTIKRYEIQPRPDRLQWYGVALSDLQAAVAASNQNFSGDIHVQGDTAQVICALGLIGGGRDPLQQVLAIKPPPDPDHILTPEVRQRLHAREAANFLTAEEEKRREEIRQIVIKSVDNKPVRVGNLVDDDRLDATGKLLERRGVLVGHQTRQGA